MIKARIHVIAVCIFTFASLAFAEEKELQELKDIKTDIQIINLLNNLDLRKEQIELILSKAEEIERSRQSAYEEALLYKARIIQAYSTIKKEVASGRVALEEKDVKDFHAIEHKIEEAVKALKERTDIMATEVEARLEGFQLLALDNYKPCVIPIVSQGRIGQADKAVGIVKALERVKKVPQARYSMVKDKIITQTFDKIKEKAPPALLLDEAKIKAEITATFESVREMEDVDFELKKASIAEKLRDKIAPQKPLVSSRKEKIKKFLLSKNVIAILKEKLNLQSKASSL